LIRPVLAALAVAAGVSPAVATDSAPPTAPSFVAARAAFNAALEAEKAGDAPGYLSQLEQAVATIPDPARLLYRLAAARLAAGDRAGAIDALRRQVDAGVVRDPRGDAAFAALAVDADFLAVMRRLDEVATPIVASNELFRDGEPDGLFEGIAFDPRSGSYYLSSVRHRKVVRRATDGTLTDFVSSGAHGLASALGLAIDSDRRLLWIVSAGLPHAQGLPPAERDTSAVLAVSLDTGALVRRVAAPAGKHLWNDLALARDGSVYVSDTADASVVRVAPSGETSIVVRSEELRSPGGLALTTDERRLFVADWSTGLAVIDLASGELTWIRAPGNATLLGIDGLVRVGGDLVAIQNGVDPPRITRLRFAADGELRGVDLLERGVPDWNEPTLGTQVAGDLVYVATSQWPSFGDDGQPLPTATLTSTSIRRLPLGSD